MNYCNITDVATLFRPLTASEQERAEALIPVICSTLRLAASRSGIDLDALVKDEPDYAEVAKSVCVDIVARTLNTSTTAEPMTQFAQSAGGYSVSGTFLTPGGGIFIKKAELARLGIKRQRWGALNVYA